MLANIERKSVLRLLVAGLCSAILTLTALTLESSASTVHTNSTATTNSGTTQSGTCLYVNQLATDPALRAAFTNSFNEHPETDNSDIYESDIKSGLVDTGNTGDRTTLDTFSNNCLSCHDGVMAMDFKLRIKNDPNGRVMSLEDIIGGHPVGMLYETYVAAKSGTYNNNASFSKEMIFADGKIGCLTCHNPLNEKKGHLVMNNDRSELCFACHNK